MTSKQLQIDASGWTPTPWSWWDAVSLKSVLPLKYGKSLPERDRDPAGEIPVYGSSGIVGYHSKALIDGPCLIVGRKGSIGSVFFEPGPCWPIDTVYFIESDDVDFLRYSAYFLRSLKLERLDRSTAIPGLSRSDYDRLDVAIPPPEDQKRIVAAIETQFARLDDAVAARARARTRLKRYRASVLKAACEGRLVPTEAALAHQQARGYEPAGDLLERIRANRTVVAGKRAGRSPSAPTDIDLPPLPEGWAWSNLRELSCLVTSGSRGWSSYYSNEGALFIRAQDINTDTLNLSSVAKVKLPPKAEGSRTLIQQGDLLVTITGANVTKTARVAKSLPEAYVSQHVGLVRLVDPCLGAFLYYWIVSPTQGRKLLEKAAYGAGKPGLGLDDLRDLAVPVPPLAEQNRIVAEVERRLSVLDRMEAEVAANLKRAESLRQAILRRAFSGNL